MEEEIRKLRDVLYEHTHNNIDGTTKLVRSVFIPFNLVSTSAQTSTNYGVFFIAPFPCNIKSIIESHTVAGTDVGAVTLQVEKLTDGVALTSGVDILQTAFDLKSTANSYERGILTSNKPDLSLSLGDRLALKKTGTLTSLEGLSVVVEIQF